MGRSGALLLGLTGGIGSGKSTVAALLAGHGAHLVDADAISRAATATGGGAIGEIADQFGTDFIQPDGALDRERMRSLVFGDNGARKRLESVVHPIVGAEIARQTRQAITAGAACVVIEIPLLVESGRWRKRLHRVLAVDCSAQTQLRRVAMRDRMDERQAMQIVAAQAPRTLRLAAADFVVPNDQDCMPALEDRIGLLARHLGL